MTEPTPSQRETSQRTVLLELAYDGQPYAGFAVQTNARTVGGELLDAIHHFDPSVGKLNVASRTDAGVHARTQRVSFDTTHHMPMRAWVLGLGRRLPDSIAIRQAHLATPGYNPRYRTVRKRYRYLVLCDRLSDPFLVGRAWRLHQLRPEHAEKMADELALLQGRHDFAAFASARDQRQHTEREMSKVSVSLIAERLIAIDISGDGFLHNMVRIMVGTVVDVARGTLAAGAVTRAFTSKDRRDLGVTAPPDGLYLEELELDEPPQGECWP